MPQLFVSSAHALRLLSQAGLYPANCRILDAEEAFNTGARGGSMAIMVLAFESADHPAGRLDGAGAGILC